MIRRWNESGTNRQHPLTRDCGNAAPMNTLRAFKVASVGSRITDQPHSIKTYCMPASAGAGACAILKMKDRDNENESF